MNRRELIGATLGSAAAVSASVASAARAEISDPGGRRGIATRPVFIPDAPGLIGVDVREWTIGGDRTIAFEWFGGAGLDSKGGLMRPLQIGERFYFDGRPWGAPELRGVVARIRTRPISNGGCFQSVVLRDV